LEIGNWKLEIRKGKKYIYINKRGKGENGGIFFKKKKKNKEYEYNNDRDIN